VPSKTLSIRLHVPINPGRPVLRRRVTSTVAVRQPCPNSRESAASVRPRIRAPAPPGPGPRGPGCRSFVEILVKEERVPETPSPTHTRAPESARARVATFLADQEACAKCRAPGAEALSAAARRRGTRPGDGHGRPTDYGPSRTSSSLGPDREADGATLSRCCRASTSATEPRIASGRSGKRADASASRSLGGPVRVAVDVASQVEATDATQSSRCATSSSPTR